MTEKQKRFCEEYLIDLNATRAAIRAGYSPNGISKRVTRMMANDGVSEYIAQLTEEVKSKRIADATEVMEYLTSVVRGESQAEVVVVEGEGDGCSSARRIMKAPDEKEKLKAAELLAKRYGLLTEKVSMSGEGIVQIVDNIPKGDSDG